jgi:multidrug efflux system membrane fusion protein
MLKRIFSDFTFLTLLILYSACSNKSADEQSVKPVPVTTAPVRYGIFPEIIERSGLLATGREARLSFKVGGFINRVFADEGSFVHKGQLLAVLNLSEINAQVELARTGYEKTRRDHERVSRLYSDSVATLEQLQDAESAFDAARASLEIAQFNLKHARITAPSDGRILKQFLEENEMVGPGTPVFYFGSSAENWIVKLGVTDRELVKLAIGDSARVRFDAFPDRSIPGSITGISESVNARNGTFEIEITLQHSPLRLASGFVAHVTLFPEENEPHYLIPVEALVEAELDSGFIYCLSDTARKPVKMQVRVGRITGNQVIILSDLGGVNKVIVAGNAYLTGDTEIIQVESN